eukprot:CAMPEP_0167748564 /NCGR_PEP_ID=MMETSP0110_2-20121227/4909_1 /TAXON_ID=629695 /ORGANISM="Gymnochlora sp., Strain CCMP2014" /LENGTH=100 /DNA_ID=CAMNT_0007633595 /DNA_START=42 /DNA_END=344 /DNA_ORIENTATION=+
MRDAEPPHPILVGTLPHPKSQIMEDFFPPEMDVTLKKTPNGPRTNCTGCKSPKPQWSVAVNNSGVLPVDIAPCQANPAGFAFRRTNNSKIAERIPCSQVL